MRRAMEHTVVDITKAVVSLQRIEAGDNERGGWDEKV